MQTAGRCPYGSRPSTICTLHKSPGQHTTAHVMASLWFWAPGPRVGLAGWAGVSAGPGRFRGHLPCWTSQLPEATAPLPPAPSPTAGAPGLHSAARQGGATFRLRVPRPTAKPLLLWTGVRLRVSGIRTWTFLWELLPHPSRDRAPDQDSSAPCPPEVRSCPAWLCLWPSVRSRAHGVWLPPRRKSCAGPCPPEAGSPHVFPANAEPSPPRGGSPQGAPAPSRTPRAEGCSVEGRHSCPQPSAFGGTTAPSDRVSLSPRCPDPPGRPSGSQVPRQLHSRPHVPDAWRWGTGRREGGGRARGGRAPGGTGPAVPAAGGPRTTRPHGAAGVGRLRGSLPS